jgi:phage gp46-like protein
MSQQGDVVLFHTADGGEILVEQGVVAMDGGLQTMVYLSLFGGDVRDAAGDDKTLTWWGNLSETAPNRQYRSETQNLLRALVASPQNLLRIEDASRRDLQWMIDEGAASSVDVFVNVKGLNTIGIRITVVAEGVESEFVYAENWKASA